eukprot:jgi/Astpho2/6502/Aster-06962
MQLTLSLQAENLLQGPACYDALSAKLVEQAGFPFAFSSGFSISAARLGMPDAGLISYAEMLDQGRSDSMSLVNMHEATTSLPIVGDGDTGYGNAVNVKRTVMGYAAAGFAGILIEDQVSPKSCGHVRNKQVVSRAEAVQHVRAAVDARREGQDIVIVARSDARQADSLQEALWRVSAFADEGADVLFIDALASVDEMAAFGALGSTPKMASILEGGGKTPAVHPHQLEEMGFKLVAYPLSLLSVSVRAQQVALQQLKQGYLPDPEALTGFEELQRVVGFPAYWEDAARQGTDVFTQLRQHSGLEDAGAT